MNFNETQEFNRDFKKISKKFKSLENDLVEFEKVLNEAPLGIGKHFNVITKSGFVHVVKARFFCRYLKGRTLRIVYAYNQEKKFIEFIEIYFKGNKQNEDRNRIGSYLQR